MPIIMIANIVILFNVMRCKSELFFVDMLIFRGSFFLSELNLLQMYYMFMIWEKKYCQNIEKGAKR